MNKIIQITVSLLLVLGLTAGFCACTDNKSADKSTETTGSEMLSEETTEKISKTGLWSNAIYLNDTELGNGKNAFTVEIKVENQSIRIKIHTDKSTVGDALTELGLIEGENAQYGLFVKKVNGITADYNADQSYWAFYINGQYASSGVDSTEITDGATYQLEYTK